MPVRRSLVGDTRSEDKGSSLLLGSRNLVNSPPQSVSFEVQVLHVVFDRHRYIPLALEHRWGWGDR